MNKRLWQGSVTIESAIIIPVVMICVMTVLYFSLYIHDVAAIQATINSIQLSQYDITKEELKERVNRQLLVIKQVSIDIEEKDKKQKIIEIKGENYTSRFKLDKQLDAGFIKKYKVLMDGIDDIVK